MDYHLEIQKIRIKVDAEILPINKANLLRQAISMADLHNDIEWGYDLRIELMDVSEGIIKNTDALPAFVWLLDACDQHPDLFDESELLWKYKWMIDSAARSSKISLQQITAIAEDFKIRLQRNGYSLRAYYSILVAIGFITENMEMVRKNLQYREEHERDNLSDSASHDLYDKVLYLLMLNDITAALEFENEAQQKSRDNISNLFAINTCYAEYLARTGTMDAAKRFVDNAENNFNELIHKECYLMVTLSSLIYALTITDTEKAWAYFERFAHWFDEGEEYDTLIFGLNCLPLLSKGGRRKLELSSGFDFYRSDNDYTINVIYNYFYEVTHKLAIAFDVRNNNDAFKKQLEINTK